MDPFFLSESDMIFFFIHVFNFTHINALKMSWFALIEVGTHEMNA